ncbi:hypothetical protein F5Y04DRAFT_251759 [Hypomontagnella monticulosa]|nr:hypothetical protein F5Y04DRAFT_251759 [Hypomontagnella monticulosa]
MTSTERAEWHKQIQKLEAGLSKEQLDSWSYRLSDLPGSNSDKSSKLYTDWFPLDTEKQYEKMCSLIKERQLSAMFIRTWRIDEAKRVARMCDTTGHDLEPDNPPEDEHPEQGSDPDEGSSEKPEQQPLANGKHE